MIFANKSPETVPDLPHDSGVIDSYVRPPGTQADIIQNDCDQWLNEPNRRKLSTISYFFNTRKPAEFALTYNSKSGHMPITSEGLSELDTQAKEGLDIVFYQLMGRLPAGTNANAYPGLASFETVAFWGGATSAMESAGYDVRAIIVDEASGMADPVFGLGENVADTTASSLTEYAARHGISDRVLIRPMREMLESEHRASVDDAVVDSIRTSKAESLREAIDAGADTLQTARIKLLIGQMSALAIEELGIAPYLDNNGVLPEHIKLSDLPRKAVEHVMRVTVDFDASMALRGHLIADAEQRGTDLPELGQPDRHTMRAGTTKSPTRHTVRLVHNGRDPKGRVIQVPYAVPAYGRPNGVSPSGKLQGFARYVDLKNEGYETVYRQHEASYDIHGRVAALHEPNETSV